MLTLELASNPGVTLPPGTVRGGHDLELYSCRTPCTHPRVPQGRDPTGSEAAASVDEFSAVRPSHPLGRPLSAAECSQLLA